LKLTSVTAFLVASSEAFQPAVRLTAPLSVLKSSRPDLHEFDALLGHGSSSQAGPNTQKLRAAPSPGRRIVLPSQPGERTVVFASSTTLAAPGVEDETAVTSQDQEDADPYGDFTLQDNEAMQRYQEYKEKKSLTIEDRLKQMDFQDVVSTLIIPSIFGFAALRWGFNRARGKVVEKTDDTLDSFASEMIYHDGDFEEMKLCFKDYSKKLAWMGPKKTPAMLKRYLQMYSKKKTVSPQSITSLSYVFSLFQLSEEKAAQILVSLCREMGDEKIASAGKLLFFGSRILKSPEGKAALVPIRDMIKATYREAAVAEEMVETSQQAMAEAAYRTTVIAGGKTQQTLTVGWEVLGLDKETATRIFEDEAKEGFVTDREKMYGGQNTKYDAKGNVIDKDGKLLDPENAIEGSDDDTPTSNVYECSDCGYTLFVAKGRESKFFGEGFKCPECGAAKDKFKPKDIEED